LLEIGNSLSKQRYRTTAIQVLESLESEPNYDRLNNHLFDFVRGDRNLTQQQKLSNDLMCFRGRSQKQSPFQVCGQRSQSHPTKNILK